MGRGKKTGVVREKIKPRVPVPVAGKGPTAHGRQRGSLHCKGNIGCGKIGLLNGGGVRVEKENTRHEEKRRQPGKGKGPRILKGEGTWKGHMAAINRRRTKR